MSKITPAALSATNEADFLLAILPGGIEAQEAAGQVAFVNSAMLPKNMLHGCTKEKLEAMGIKFLDDADDIFVNVVLPTGWKKVATDHSMWSDLLDEKGRKRAAIFYKAAFYDRTAHISLCRRYSTSSYNPMNEAGEPVEYGQHTHLAITVGDCGKTIHTVGISKSKDYDHVEELENLAVAYLNKNFPSWEDELSYWD